MCVSVRLYQVRILTLTNLLADKSFSMFVAMSKPPPSFMRIRSYQSFDRSTASASYLRLDLPPFCIEA